MRAAAAACEGVDENSAASVCEGVDENARAWTKLVAIQTVAQALPAADCVDCIEQRMQGVGWLCGTHCWKR